MKSIECASFRNLAEFREYTNKATLLYLYIYSGTPDQRMLDALSGCGPEEALVLIDREKNQVFLREAGLDKDGLGVWTKGAFIDFTDTVGGVSGLISNGRRFAFPPSKTLQEKQRLIEELSWPSSSRQHRRG